MKIDLSKPFNFVILYFISFVSIAAGIMWIAPDPVSIPVIELRCPDSDSLQTRVWELENLYTEVHLDRVRIMSQLIISEAELHATKFKIYGRDFDDLNEVIR